jgi:transposase
MESHALRDDQFARIEHLLPGRPGTVGRNSDLGNRLFVDPVIWKFRMGTPWARFAGTFWRLVQHAQAFLSLGRERGLGESFQGLGRQSRQ